MHMWKNEIRQRLEGLRLELAREAEIVEELTQHLDDRYAELLAGGLTEEEAICAILSDLNDSDLLARELRLVERRASQQPIVSGAIRRSNMIGDLWMDLR
jgi:putative ABC transport system permease protein